jgi:hypothetical protein
VQDRIGRVNPVGQNLQDARPSDQNASRFNARLDPGKGIPAAVVPRSERNTLNDEFARLAAAVAALQSRQSTHDLMSPDVTYAIQNEPRKPSPAAGSDVASFQLERAARSAPTDNQGSAYPGAKAADQSATPASSPLFPMTKGRAEPLTAAVPRPAQWLTSARPEVRAVASSQSALQPRPSPMPRPAAATTTARRVIAAAPLPPTVHVSIGRIEIRAVSAASGGPKSSRSIQSSGPKLSLDDYLKSRNGARR